MSTITTRSGKGTPLTNAEVDANFINLNTDKVEKSSATLTADMVVPYAFSLKSSGQTRNDILKNYWDGGQDHLQIQPAGGTAGAISLLSGGVEILKVTGSGATVGGTTGTYVLNVDGGTAADEGGYVRFSKGGTVKGYVGLASAVLGGGSTSDSLAYFLPGANNHNFYSNSALVGQFSSTGLSVTGTLSATGNVTQGAGTTADAGNWSKLMLTSIGSVGAVVEVGSSATPADGKFLGAIGFSNTGSGVTSKGSAAIIAYQSGTNAASPGSKLVFQTRTDGGAAADRLTIDSTGHVGVGLTPNSSNSMLQVSGGIHANVGAGDNAPNPNKAVWISKDGGGTYNGIALQYNASNGLDILVGDGSAAWAKRLTLDVSGNLGLSQTPAAWASAKKAIDLTYGSFYSGGADSGVVGNAFVAANGQWQYRGNNPALLYQHYLGAHWWYSAPTGTSGPVTAGSFVVGKSYSIVSAGTTDFTLIGAANNTVGTVFTATGVGTGTGTATQNIQWNSYMALDANGNLGIGAVNSNAKLNVEGPMRARSRMQFGGTETTGTSANWYYLGTISLADSQTATIKVQGTQGYSAGTPIAGETTILLRGDNNFSGIGVNGFFYGTTQGNTLISDVAMKVNTGRVYDIWIKPSGQFHGMNVFADCSGVFTPNTSDTGSLTQPAGSTLLPSLFTIATGGTERLRVDANGYVGIGTNNPDVKLRISGSNVANKGQLLIDAPDFAHISMYNGATRKASLYMDTSQATTGDLILGNYTTSGNIIFGTANGQERVRVGASGRMSVGVTQDTTGSTVQVGGGLNLVVSGNAGSNTVDSNKALWITKDNSATYNGFAFQLNASYGMDMYVGNGSSAWAKTLTVDASGNLGLGVTPSAWQSSYKAMQFGAYGSAWYSTGTIGLTDNAYYNAGWKYANTDYASNYQQGGGGHTWYGAASGTAGAALTWTQVLGVEKDKTLALQGATTQTGAGVSFPATQVASSDANSLDDYEEGTFTPTVTGTSTAGTGTYSKQIGRYQKVGNRVHFTIHLSWSAHTGAGNMQVSGLPFTASNATNVVYAPNIYYEGLTVGAGKELTAFVGNSSSAIQLFSSDPAGTGVTAVVLDTAVTALIITGHYEV